MNELQIFNNEEFGQVRTVEENGKLLFCGGDVAKALGYSQVAHAITRHCKEDGCTFQTVIDSLGREQQAKFIDEGNVYRLIVGSKLPAAEKFEKWLFETVVPTIRKHGIYVTDQRLQEMLMRPDTIINIALTLKREQLKNVILSEDNAVMQPKADYFDALVDRNLLKGARHFCGSDWSLRSGAPHGRGLCPPHVPLLLSEGADNFNDFFVSKPRRRLEGVRGGTSSAREAHRRHSLLGHFRRNDMRLETFRLLCSETEGGNDACAL